MATIASPAPAKTRVRTLSGIRIPLWAAVVCSRLLVLAAGAFGELMYGRVAGWSQFDPTRLTTSLGSVGDALIATSVRWDSLHFLGVAQHGYGTTGDPDFYPFYPLLIHVVSWFVGSDVIAGLLISAAAFAIALVLVHRLAREELGDQAANAIVLLLAFAPLSFFYTAIYSEGLNLALAVGTFYLARQGRFRLACLAAACAALTHVEGVLLTAPLAMFYWEKHRGPGFALRRLISWDLAALMLPAFALLGYAFYMHTLHAGWFAPILGRPSVSHSNQPVMFLRTVSGPAVTFWRALVAALQGLRLSFEGHRLVAPATGAVFSLGFQNVFDFLILVISIAALVGAWRRLPKPYAVYAGLVILLYASSVVATIPLLAFDRYMLPVFPLWMSAGAWLRERRLMPFALEISVLLLILFAVETGRWAAIA